MFCDSANLFSVNSIVKRGFSARSSKTGIVFYTQTGEKCLEASLSEEGRLLMLFRHLETHHLSELDTQRSSNGSCEGTREDNYGVCSYYYAERGIDVSNAEKVHKEILKYGWIQVQGA